MTLEQLKMLIDADIRDGMCPAPNLTFAEWQAISAAIAKATGAAV